MSEEGRRLNKNYLNTDVCMTATTMINGQLVARPSHHFVATYPNKKPVWVCIHCGERVVNDH